VHKPLAWTGLARPQWQAQAGQGSLELTCFNQRVYKMLLIGNKPTIIVVPTDAEWKEAYSNWIKGKNPTDSPEWKKGVFLTFQLY
jgi:hypothetical protein